MVILTFDSYSLELNLSATESALTLILHYSTLQKHHEKALLVRTCI